MEKITNYFQLNKFIRDNINTQKYKNNRNLTILVIFQRNYY